jgi:hypothetical protein
MKLWFSKAIFDSKTDALDIFGQCQPGAKDFDYTEHSFAVSEWSTPADTTIKV